MVSIEQVRLLESRVIKTIEYVDQVKEENALLKGKLDTCQKRIDELEVLIQRFKEDQTRIEEGIISSLDRLNKFEDDMGNAPEHKFIQGSNPARERSGDDSESGSELDIF
jgi:FtsZ-binding cell division protein ZapB